MSVEGDLVEVPASPAVEDAVPVGAVDAAGAGGTGVPDPGGELGAGCPLQRPQDVPVGDAAVAVHHAEPMDGGRAASCGQGRYRQRWVKRMIAAGTSSSPTPAATAQV